MKPIYVPSGKAKEYGDYAINIYTGCPHRCYYCFAPSVLRRDREEFHTHVEPRKNIVEEVKRQLGKEQITGKLIHLCFTCDPYPSGYDSSATREIIKAIKETGNHVQILTKGDGSRDFDLLDKDDWYGATISCGTAYAKEKEPNALDPFERRRLLLQAKELGISTWLSCEPVLDAEVIWHIIKFAGYIDKYKIGKLNYHPSDINWKEFGKKCEQLCITYGRDYYIKDSLREEMNHD
ncbi:MAG: radical SAM protein [Candidatus Omnitrophota bacterium]